MNHPDVKPSYVRPKWMPHSCPVMERTGDGKPAGRCYFYMTDGNICPRHGRLNFVEDEKSSLTPSIGRTTIAK